MIFTTVDMIVRSMLIQKRLPLHYYLEYLKYACDGLRELTFDSLRVVNTVELTINQDGHYATLPCDYVDFTKIGIKQGQFVQPVTQRDSMNRLPNHNLTGNIINYGDANSVNLDFPFWPGYWMFQNVDDLGENIGRLFGYNTGIANDGFKVIRERGIIQVTESFDMQTLVLEYISNGLSVDNVTQVDPYAQAAIEAYMAWKSSRNAAIDQSPEAVSFGNQQRILRARKADETVWDIRQVLYRNYKSSVKN